MNASKTLSGSLLAGASLLLPAAAKADLLTQIASFQGVADSAEIVSFDKYSKLAFSSAANGVEIVNFANPAAPTSQGLLNLSVVDSLAIRSISSVAADPLGRGFGVATAIPTESGSNLGKLVFFDPATKAVLKTLDVGYHPDSVKFSADGTKLFIANEGEPLTQTGGAHFDRPGSLSVVDVSSGFAAASLTGTYDFSSANLAPGVDLSQARVHPSNNAAGNRHFDIEPEFITQQGNRVFVTLQENNAVGEFDLASGKWTSVKSLGVINQTVDASDREINSSTGKIEINDKVAGLPMPDAIASYQVGGKTFLVTANEGDSRPPDFVASGHPVTTDEARVSQLGTGGRPALDPAYKAQLDALYGGNALANSAIGRLTISIRDGDTDNDGDIDRLTMFGTRSFTIWDADTATKVYDSGSDFEFISAALFPALFNSDGTSATFDTRSDNKGPEPEALTIGRFNGRTVAFIGLERTGGIMSYDITDPANAFFLQYINTGEVAPESLQFVPDWESPTGAPLLIAGYEVSSRIGVYSIDIAAVPEVSTIAPAFVGLAFGGWLLRRRKQATA